MSKRIVWQGLCALMMLGAMTGCETIADGDPCDRSELDKYECTAGETVFRCTYRDSERVWTRVDSCPRSQECVVREGARSYECRDDKMLLRSQGGE